MHSNTFLEGVLKRHKEVQSEKGAKGKKKRTRNTQKGTRYTQVVVIFHGRQTKKKRKKKLILFHWVLAVLVAEGLRKTPRYRSCALFWHIYMIVL